MIIVGLIAGTLAGVILLFFSHLAPYVGAGNFVSELAGTKMMGKRVTRREGQFVGMLVHVLVSAASGGLYMELMRYSVVADAGLFSILGWSAIMATFIGGVIMPLEGHGLFGIKEDAWFPIDLFLTNIGWGILFWWLLPTWLSALG